MRKNATIIIMAVVILSLAGWVFFLSHKINKQEPQELTREILQKNYPYLSKRIFAENQNDILINFIPLRTALREYVEMQDGKVGVYFEYLSSGTSIGVNDKYEIKIVSLAKVPMVMSIFKKIERKKLSLDDMLVIKKEHLNQEFGNLWKRGDGIQLSVKELIQLALTESDNTAYNVLSEQLIGKEIDETYESLDITLNKEASNEGIYLLISPKNYSSIFRSLYLSSFLSEEHSNLILDILTQTAFNDKITAGVPTNIKVAHKIGVFDKQNLFSDCGIIYVPQRPYILCTFVQDTDEQAQKHMSYLSRMIYEYIATVKTE